MEITNVKYGRGCSSSPWKLKTLEIFHLAYRLQKKKLSWMYDIILPDFQTKLEVTFMKVIKSSKIFIYFLKL